MKKQDLDHLKDIENSTRDLYKNHGNDIATGGFLRLSVRVIVENKWLCEQLRIALGIRRSRVADDIEEGEDALSEAEAAKV